MRCDYKFWYIKRDDDGFIVEAAVRFFLGDYQMVNILDGTGNVREIRRLYVRNQRLSPMNLPMFNNLAIQDVNGNYAFKLTAKDFGPIKTDTALISFCNAKLAQVATIMSATPITVQT